MVTPEEICEAAMNATSHERIQEILAARQYRVMIRDVLDVAPDGNSVKRTERVRVILQFPKGVEEPEEYSGYARSGEWRLLPRECE